MGLDNGIIIRNKQTKEEVTCEEANISFQFFMGDNSSTILYMRKYWGVRNEIVDALDMQDDYEKILTSADIQTIIGILWNFTDKEYFEENAGSSIWDWQEALSTLMRGICNLKIILNDIEVGNLDLDKYEIVFYDSY